jgi:alpha-amylase/alpha-mannosidase (GH57 family)
MNEVLEMEKLRLAFLWHMHQPPYEEPSEKTFILPWVYLHGIRDYYDMGALLLKHPGIKLIFNFTPSLMSQLKSYIEGQAKDRYISIASKHPRDMTNMEKSFIIKNFFSARAETMIDPYPRYFELLQIKRLSDTIDDAIKNFSNQDFFDTQVWFFLTWSGKTLKADPEIKKLIIKGRNFNEEDKKILFSRQHDLLCRIQGLYLDLMNRGQAEISTSPFYHPILPLLCDFNSASEADPQIKLPEENFHAPEEADRQVRLSIQYFEKVFSRKPAGMWPSEGAVSQQIFPILERHGLRWIATDECIMKKYMKVQNLPRNVKCTPQKFGNVAIFFRDQFLSDQIGFVYSNWKNDDAVSDFIKYLKQIHSSNLKKGDIVVVAMDGENAWEFYKNGGYDFLDELYTAVEKSEFLETVTFSGYLGEFPDLPVMEKVPSLSWIGGNLNTWIGDAAKNKAWVYLTNAYKIMKDLKAEQAEPNNIDVCSELRNYILKAEASDWFWWYGKGHSSPYESEFDFLFRQYLKSAYEKINVKIPNYLDDPIEEKSEMIPVVKPVRYIEPRITGTVDSFYKWTGAGYCEIAQGSIHRFNPVIKKAYFGFSRDMIYLRVDGFERAEKMCGEGLCIQIEFVLPRLINFAIKHSDGKYTMMEKADENTLMPVASAEAGVKEVLECSIPVRHFFQSEKPPQKIKLEFHFVIKKDEQEIDRFPWGYNIELDYYPEYFDDINWFV